MCAVLVALTLCCGAARAEDDDAAAARQHFKAATGHFAVGEFTQAAVEYEAAFKLHQDPALLFNAAQARRLAGDNQKALVLYKNFLQLYPNSPNTEVVRDQVARLQEAINASEKAKSSPPTGTEPPGAEHPGAATATAPPAKQPASAAAPAAQAAAPAVTKSEGPRPIYKKWWLWTAVGGAVVLAVVIPVAVVYSQPSWNNLPTQGPGAQAAAIGHVPAVEVRW